MVTGSHGFAGRHLVARLHGDGHEVVGLVRAADDEPLELPVEVADLLDEDAVRTAVRRVKPEVIYHLAAASSPGQSVKTPLQTLSTNLLGTATVLHASLSVQPSPRVLNVTSSEVYGAPPRDAPLTEESPAEPRNAYGVSKLAAHHLAMQLHRTAGLDVVEARPFNHLGPGQRLGFVAPDFASQVAAIAAGQQAPVMRVGDLSAERDFSDVRDIVDGYVRLVENGLSGEAYHLCSGRPTSILELLETLIGLSGVEVTIKPDPDRMRPAEIPRVVGSYAKVERLCGWTPRRSLETSLGDVLREWQQTASSRG